MTEHPVEIIRSPRRRKTVQATVVNGTIQVRVPAGLGSSEERKAVDDIVRKVRRKISAGPIDLTARAARLARRYNLPDPMTVTWSDRQNLRWGSCTPANGAIRISTRLASVPPFVLDYVLVHELAHLVVSGHGPEFDRIVDRYEKAERARGFLLALNQQDISSVEPE